MYYEVIYETGNHSIMCCESDEEALVGLKEHHRRAVAGEKAQATNPLMGPAERIVKVFKYKDHPATYGESQALPVDVTKELLDKAFEKVAVGDMVSVTELAAEVRDLTNPTVESGPHETNYKMEDDGTLEGWAA